MAGSFVYHPPAGAVLGIGTHVLRVRFTPSVGTTYVYASKSVVLTVGPVTGTPVISSALSASATVGVPFAYQITASQAPTATNTQSRCTQCDGSASTPMRHTLRQKKAIA